MGAPSSALALMLARAGTAVPQSGDLQPTNCFVTPRGEQLFALGMPGRTELARIGAYYTLKSAAIACQTALPTTTAPISLWNGAAVGSNSCIVIDGITWTCTTSAAAASSFSLAVCLGRANVTTQPATTDTRVVATNNGKTYAGNIQMSHTVTITDDNWVPIGGTFTTALTATVGSSVDVPIDGAIIIPPQRLLSLTCIAANTTAAGLFAVRFAELVLTDQI